MTAQRPFRFGVVAASADSGDEWIAKARRIEALGYSTLLTPDTLGPTLAPFPALSVAATATQTLRVGTFVLANDYRNPVFVARESAALDFLSNGRFELGLGAGRPNAELDYRKLGIPFEPGGARVTRLAESLGIIKSLLNGETASGTSSAYLMADADVFPRPVQQPQPPIMIAASGDRLLGLAAREADIITLGVPPDETADAFAARIDVIRREAGERLDNLELSVNLIAAGQQMPSYIQRLGLDLEQMKNSGTPVALIGSVDEMCDQLLSRREQFGVSYIAVADELMESFALVVERMTGQ
jgi:probable F420-dependent oxidoreductase